MTLPSENPVTGYRLGVDQSAPIKRPSAAGIAGLCQIAGVERRNVGCADR
jgi:hypothetical protein